MKKSITFFLFFLITTFSALCQDNPIDKDIAEEKYSEVWKLYSESENVQIMYKINTCEGNLDCCDLLFFKVVNKSGSQLDLSWIFDLGWCENNGGPITSQSSRKVSIALAAGESAEANCDNTNDDLMFYIREKSSPDANVLSHVEITELSY